MVDQVLLLLQALFLLVLFLFLWWVVRSAGRDLRLPQDTVLVVPGAAAPAPLGRLVVERSPSQTAGDTFALGPAPVTIGRSSENMIALAADDYASARHARIDALRDGLWIVDLDSTNGTYLNGHPVEGRERLSEGDVVRIGETELRVER